VCPMCGQRMLIRHGVRLSPKLADLFDMIERCGKHGVQSEVLASVFYPGKCTAVAQNCIRQNVHHLNALLAETEIEVRASRHEPYRVLKRRKA